MATRFGFTSLITGTFSIVRRPLCGVGSEALFVRNFSRVSHAFRGFFGDATIIRLFAGNCIISGFLGFGRLSSCSGIIERLLGIGCAFFVGLLAGTGIGRSPFLGSFQIGLAPLGFVGQPLVIDLLASASVVSGFLCVGRFRGRFIGNFLGVGSALFFGSPQIGLTLDRFIGDPLVLGLFASCLVEGCSWCSCGCFRCGLFGGQVVRRFLLGFSLL